MTNQVQYCSFCLTDIEDCNRIIGNADNSVVICDKCIKKAKELVEKIHPQVIDIKTEKLCI